VGQAIRLPTAERSSPRDNCCMPDWKSAILAAHQRIASVVRETPVEEAPLTPGVELYLKLEHLQHTGSFKFRGASHKIALLTPQQAQAGVIAASNGNHGLGVAAAARSHGIPAEVFVSSQVSPAKARRIEALGARIRYAGQDPLVAELAARRAAEESGQVFISPYNDADVIAGQGTIAVELLRQIREPIDAVFVAAGGGGLMGGVGAYCKAVSPATEIVGCWPANSPVLHECMLAGRVVDVAEKPTLSESTSGGLEPGTVTVDLCRQVMDRPSFVSEEQILSAMRLMLETEHWLIEGAAGVALACLLQDAERYQGKRVVVVICGRNVSPEVGRQLVQGIQRGR
jgi:threonine dehydratase